MFENANLRRKEDFVLGSGLFILLSLPNLYVILSESEESLEV